MKKIFLILITLTLTACGTVSDMTKSVKGKMKNLGKNPCYDKETNTTKLFCKK